MKFQRPVLLIVIITCFVMISCDAATTKKQLDETSLKLKQIEDELQRTKNELESAKRIIDELQSTPEKKYAVLVERVQKLDNLNSVPSLEESIGDFIKKYPTGEFTRSAKNLLSTVVDKKKELQDKHDTIVWLKSLSDFRSILTDAKDGSSVDVNVLIPLIKLVKDKYPLRLLKTLPSTDYRSAMKDPDAERGKVIRFTGGIVEISKTPVDDVILYEGGIYRSADVVRFIALGSTDNIYQKTNATFYGVFSQVYSYANVSGGVTNAVVCVGYFDIKDNQ